jgi:hypothetical protein
MGSGLLIRSHKPVYGFAKCGLRCNASSALLGDWRMLNQTSTMFSQDE